MFRRVDLPARIPGTLLLHSMPGRFEAIERVWRQVQIDAVRAIVCLTEKYEIRLKSSNYADALEAGAVPCSVLPFEIREGGVPADRGSQRRAMLGRVHDGRWHRLQGEPASRDVRPGRS